MLLAASLWVSDAGSPVLMNPGWKFVTPGIRTFDFFRVQGKSSPQNPTFLQDLLINSTLAISQSIFEIFFQPVSSVRGSARHPSGMKGAGSSSQGAFGCDAAAFAASSELDNFSFCISQSSLATKHSDTPFRKPFAFLLPCLVFFVIVIVVGSLSYLIIQCKFR